MATNENNNKDNIVYFEDSVTIDLITELFDVQGRLISTFSSIFEEFVSTYVLFDLCVNSKILYCNKFKNFVLNQKLEGLKSEVGELK